jgi:hypothetical protein
MRRRPFSRTCSVAVWAALVCLVALDVARPVVTVPIHAAWIGLVISLIVSGLSYIGSHALSLAYILWNVVKLFSQAIAGFAIDVAKFFGKVWDFSKLLYRDVLRPFVSWAWRELQRVHRWLQDTFGPVLRFLEKVRATIFDLYTKYVRPVFDVIDAIRATLRALAALHVPFARRLEAWLADLEDRLLAPIRFVMQKVNEIIYWVNRIIDLNGFFQRVTLIESMWKYVGDSWAVLLHHQPTGISPAQNNALHARQYPALDPSQLARDRADYERTGAGALAVDVAPLLALWRASANTQ